MSHQAVTWAYEQDVQPTGAKFVLVTLANYANADGYCYPSQITLARDTGQSERAVRNHLDALEASGYLLRERRHAKSGHRKSDGFWLVGFRPLPADVAGSQPAEPAARPPAESAASETSLPATIVEPTGNYRHSLPADSAATIRGMNRQYEPSEEPSVLARAVAPRKGQRDIHWDTQVEIFGFSPARKTPEHGRWNKAVAIWRAMNATPDDMRRAALLYVERYPNMDFNAFALANRAENLLRGNRPQAPPSVNSIKNPGIRALVETTDEEYDDAARRFRRQDRRPGELFGDPRRLGAGEEAPKPDVLRRAR